MLKMDHPLHVKSIVPVPYERCGLCLFEPCRENFPHKPFLVMDAKAIAV